MIPTIEDILRRLATGDMDVATAQRYIDAHIKLAADRASVADRGVQAVPGEPVAQADRFGGDEGYRFRTWAAMSCTPSMDIRAFDSGKYVSIETQAAWLAWQYLAASVASPAAPAGRPLPDVIAEKVMLHQTQGGLRMSLDGGLSWLTTWRLKDVPDGPVTLQVAAPASPSVAQAEPSERVASLVASEESQAMKLLQYFDKHLGTVLQEHQFNVPGGGSLAAHNVRLGLIELHKLLASQSNTQRGN